LFVETVSVLDVAAGLTTWVRVEELEADRSLFPEKTAEGHKCQRGWKRWRRLLFR
jgi:hypothetical protein